MLKSARFIKNFLCAALIVVFVLSGTIVSAADSEEEAFYTITIQNSITGETQSAKAEADEMPDTMAAFFEGITGGDYDISVTYYDTETQHSSICASTVWTSEGSEDETDNIKISYYVVTEEINVMITTIHHTDDDSANFEGYNVVLHNVDTDETYETKAIADEMYDTMSAEFNNIKSGTYDVLVYTLNSESGNNSLCSSIQWTCINENNGSDIKVYYYNMTSEIEVKYIGAASDSSDNSTSSKPSATANNSTGSPKTGDTAVDMVMLVLIISAVTAVVVRKKSI